MKTPDEILIEKIKRIIDKKLLQDNKIFSYNTILITIKELGLSARDINNIKKLSDSFYHTFKEYLNFKIARLTETAINNPRQMQPILTLIGQQQELFNNLFPEDNAQSFKMPTITITPTSTKDSTRIQIDKIITE